MARAQQWVSIRARPGEEAEVEALGREEEVAAVAAGVAGGRAE
jgi:hypothetical protein